MQGKGNWRIVYSYSERLVLKLADEGHGNEAKMARLFPSITADVLWDLWPHEVVGSQGCFVATQGARARHQRVECAEGRIEGPTVERIYPALPIRRNRP